MDVSVAFAIICENQIFSLRIDEPQGEACIAAVELGSWLGCDLDEALTLLGQSSILRGLPESTTVLDVARSFWKAHVTRETQFDVDCLPGRLYAVGNGSNAFVEKHTALEQLNAFFRGEPFKLYLLISGNAGGEVLRGRVPGVTFRFNSRESGSHHAPHVHVSYGHSLNFSISLVDGSVLAGEAEYRKVRGKVRCAIDDLIHQERGALMSAWNDLTDGITVDVDALLGQIDCSGLK